jgi:hypothetical protein
MRGFRRRRIFRSPHLRRQRLVADVVCYADPTFDRLLDRGEPRMDVWRSIARALLSLCAQASRLLDLGEQIFERLVRLHGGDLFKGKLGERLLCVLGQFVKVPHICKHDP